MQWRHRRRLAGCRQSLCAGLTAGPATCAAPNSSSVSFLRKVFFDTVQCHNAVAFDANELATTWSKTSVQSSARHCSKLQVEGDAGVVAGARYLWMREQLEEAGAHRAAGVRTDVPSVPPWIQVHFSAPENEYEGASD